MAGGGVAVAALTWQTGSEVASARWEQDVDVLTTGLLRAAAPWLGGAEILDTSLQRWRYATPIEPHPRTCLVRAEGALVFAGDGYGGPRIEGAFLSGRGAAEAVLNRSV